MEKPARKDIAARFSDEMDIEIKKAMKKAGSPTVYAFVNGEIKKYLKQSLIAEALTEEQNYLKTLIHDVISEEYDRATRLLKSIEQDYIIAREDEDIYE